MQRTFPLLTMLAVALTAVGCSVPRVPKVIAPTAEVTGATLTEQTAEGASFAVTVELTNPNAFALPVSSATYRVDVGGEAYAFGGVAGASMPPEGSQTLTLTGAVPTDGRDMAGAKYDVTGHVIYIKPGEVRRVLVDSGVPPARLSFRGSGTLQ